MNLKKQIRKEMTIDRLNVAIYEQAELMANNASDFVEKKIKEAINKSGFANIILATGSSQFLFLEALKKKRD
jgi:glucosamine-6-phosphate deaminase